MNIANIKTIAREKEEKRMKEYEPGHFSHDIKQPILPHERRGMLTIQFDAKDWKVFNNVFDNEDEANAAIRIIHGAPPEIQILVAQLLIHIEKEVA